MDARFKLLRWGMRVLDLGAAPGSWSLYAAEKVGEQGVVLACDLQNTETHFPKQVRFFQEDVFERSPSFENLLAELGPFDAIISDMAPRTTGTRFTDQARSLELCLQALAVADTYLASGGLFVTKIFMGPDFQVLAQAMRGRFSTVKTFKPKSSRSESKEIFQVGMGFSRKPEAQAS